MPASAAVSGRKPFQVLAMAPPKPSGKAKAGKATPAPPVGPALGSKGVNIMAFCKEYNAKTADKPGYVIPVEITVFDDKSFTFVLRLRLPFFSLKPAGQRGSLQNPQMEGKVGKVTEAQVRAIAEEQITRLELLIN
ncbi:hypothetical protein R1flu_025953 [Riccia fluitans]|uniref:Large ribosomal subunit protein uL11m n=1 Tax=Riccia fluitans TaxID=41844 RepID=A0ABD1XHC6_9MARC